jgi:predicted metalloprotease
MRQKRWVEGGAIEGRVSAVRFRRGARIDTSQVRDLRGRRMGGAPVAIGGGGLGIAGLVIYLLLSALSGGGAPLDDLAGVAVGQGAPQSEALADCRMGEDANTQEDCRIVGYVNSIQEYWAGVFRRSGRRYEPAQTTFFEDGVQTGCGLASSQVGPFYCPRDGMVYIDLGFFDELRNRLGADGGPFAEAYVLAHEYGHHVQNVTGVLDRVRGERAGPESAAVRSELQADCYAGAWAGNAARQEQRFETPPSQADINEALDTASAIGDDRIQERAQGQVNPETWTHGSSEQRRRWFSRGYETGDPGECNTFSGSI